MLILLTKKPSVIVIDDDRDVVGVFSEFLKLNDVDVKAVGYDGRNALELYQKFRPDVVILDLLMPDYDGFYAFKQIRQEDPHAKIVILTADTKREDVEKIKLLNPNKVVPKPYDAYEMLSLIKEI